jgi:hypothetical protein
MTIIFFKYHYLYDFANSGSKHYLHYCNYGVKITAIRVKIDIITIIYVWFPLHPLLHTKVVYGYPYWLNNFNSWNAFVYMRGRYPIKNIAKSSYLFFG